MTKYNNKWNVIGFLATGRLGRIIMESLLKNNFNVTITTRDKSQKKLQSLMKSGASIVEINFREIDEFIHLIKENSNIYIGNIYQIEIIKKIIELIINSKKKINKLVFIGGANTIKISEAYGKIDKLEDEIYFKRVLRPKQSELGKTDPAALFESKKSKQMNYIANTNDGIVWKISVIRIKKSSILPP